jgi:hypothetical protein
MSSFDRFTLPEQRRLYDNFILPADWTVDEERRLRAVIEGASEKRCQSLRAEIDVTCRGPAKATERIVPGPWLLGSLMKINGISFPANGPVGVWSRRPRGWILNDMEPPRRRRCRRHTTTSSMAWRSDGQSIDETILCLVMADHSLHTIPPLDIQLRK